MSIIQLILLFSIFSCANSETDNFTNKRTIQSEENLAIENENIIDTSGTTLLTRFNVPNGYKRVELNENTFGFYLRNFPLKPFGSKVYTYDGNLKYYQEGAASVLNIDVGNKDLQQCADAVMRLKAEYHYHRKEYDSIHFNFTNGFRVDFSQWVQGYRIGSDYKSWKKTAQANTDYKTFKEYMNWIFMFAGSLSLSKELKSKTPENIMPGDVFILGGTPGHAVIVMDVAQHQETGEKIFMIAQSYMPAQDIHVLKNLNNKLISPWYSANFENVLETPEWTFDKTQLKTF
ncbi:MAG: DUF4846 domain-containing protein [Bacteroidia bacterium]